MTGPSSIKIPIFRNVFILFLFLQLIHQSECGTTKYSKRKIQTNANDQILEEKFQLKNGKRAKIMGNGQIGGQEIELNPANAFQPKNAKIDHLMASERQLNILVFVPSHAWNRSHVSFTISLVRILRQKHNVRFILPIVNDAGRVSEELKQEVGIEYYEVPNKSNLNAAEAAKLFYSDVWMEMLNNRAFMDELYAAKFDVGMAEMIRCFGFAFGIFHALQLPYTFSIKAFSPQAYQFSELGLEEVMKAKKYPTSDLRDFKAWNHRIPNEFEVDKDYRVSRQAPNDKQLQDLPIELIPAFRDIVKEQKNEEKTQIEWKFPGMDVMAKRAHFLIINSLPEIEFDGGEVLSAVANKVKYIGGIHMQKQQKMDGVKLERQRQNEMKPIEAKIAQMERGMGDGKIDGIILITFGTIVDTIKEMDDQQFKTMLNGIVRAYSRHLIIWQLTKGDKRIEELNGIGNVYSTHFMPQQVILADPRTKAFLSHCGRNSQLESVINGVPLICMPQLYDQFYNAVSVENQHIGVAMDVKCKEPSNDAVKNPNGTNELACFTEYALREALRDALVEEDLKTSLEPSRIDLPKLRRIKRQKQKMDGAANPANVLLGAFAEIAREIEEMDKEEAEQMVGHLE